MKNQERLRVIIRDLEQTLTVLQANEPDQRRGGDPTFYKGLLAGIHLAAMRVWGHLHHTPDRTIDFAPLTGDDLRKHIEPGTGEKQRHLVRMLTGCETSDDLGHMLLSTLQMYPALFKPVLHMLYTGYEPWKGIPIKEIPESVREKPLRYFKDSRAAS